MSKAKIYQFLRDKSRSILIVIIFAIVGQFAIYLLITNNYRHPILNQTIYVIDDENDFQVKEVSLDTLSPSEKLAVKKITIDKKDLLFNKNPNLLVWSSLILIMITIASASFPVFTWQIMRLRSSFHLESQHLWRSVVYAAFIVIFLFVSQYTLKGFLSPGQIIEKFGVLFHNEWVAMIIVITTLFLQTPILIVIFLVGISSGTIKFDIHIKESVEKAIAQFTNLNQVLMTALQVLAVLVVFSVLTTSALQQSIKSVLIVNSFDISPKEVSYVYGLFFSLFLGIIYVPNYLFLKSRLNNLKKEIQTGLNVANEEDKVWSENILKSISFGSSALDNLKLALTVLAPLITGFLPEQLRLFG